MFLKCHKFQLSKKRILISLAKLKNVNNVKCQMSKTTLKFNKTQFETTNFDINKQIRRDQPKLLI